MRQTRPLCIKLPADIRRWIETQSAMRKTTMTDYVIQLLVKGIHAEAIDEAVERIRELSSAKSQREMLRQVLATRYIVEAHARGPIRIIETLGTDALRWADQEVARLMPNGGNHGHQPK